MTSLIPEIFQNVNFQQLELSTVIGRNFTINGKYTLKYA